MLPTVLRRNRELGHYFDDFDQFFSPLIKETKSAARNFPSVDVHEDENNYYIDADLPGLDKKDITVNVENNVLTLSGSREDQQEDRKKGYYRFERQTGTFNRQFELGPNVDSSRAEAEFKNGVLSIKVPKREEAKPKQLDIKIS